MVKKVLLSLPKKSSYLQGVMRALNHLNIEVKFFDFRNFNLEEKIIAVFKKERSHAVKMLNQRLLYICEKFQPDLFLAMKGEMIEPDTIIKIKKIGIKTANWFPDHVDALELAIKLSGIYDYFFHFDPYAISQLKKTGRKNIYYLPFAADILPNDPLPESQTKKHLVSFIGNYDFLREKQLSRVADLGLKLWGDKKWANSKLSQNYQGLLPISKVSETLAQTQIGLNIQHSYPCDGAVLRVFEVIESNSFLLSDDRKELHNLFKIGRDLEIFKNENDLRDKTNFYLKNIKQQELIAGSGYLTARKNHTYIHRIKEIFNQTSI